MIFCKIKLTFKPLHWQGETKISYKLISLKKQNDTSFLLQTELQLSPKVSQTQLIILVG